MKILYLANIRLPTEKAHGVQIMETCAAFAAAEHEVTLVVSSWQSSAENVIFAYYNLPRTFSIKRIPSVALPSWGILGFLIGSAVFALNVRRKIEFERYDAVFTRDAFLVRSGFFYEMHDVRKGPFQRSALKRAAGVVCITKGLAEYCKKTGLEENKIMVAPDAVDLRKFFVAEDKKACRAKLGLPINKKIILYAGHLYAWKGADVLAKAASLLSSDALAVFVGGTDSDIVLFRKKFGSDQRIIIAGRQPHDLIPYYLKAADVLVLPNSAKEDISRLYTSPLKLFEYMASGVPIVASDLPSLREIIDESSAFFAKPDDPRSLAETLKRVLEDPTGAARGAETALSVVGRYDWDSRAARIISLITSLS